MKKQFSVEETMNDFMSRPFRIVLLAIVLLLVLFPLYWLTSNAVKLPAEYLQNPPILVPSKATMENFESIFASSGAGNGLLNTAVVAISTTFLCVLMGCLAAYSIAKGSLSKRIRGLFSGWFMVQKMYPAVCVAVPIYLVMRNIGLIDTRTGLVIVNTSFNLPLVIWLMIGFFQEVPMEIEESGVIDGCNMYQRFFRLVLPITKPGVIAASILTFNGAWNEFLFSAILSINKAKTLSVVISGFITDKGLEWGPMAALSLLLVLPVLILVLLLQKDFVAGLSMGSVKE